MPVRARLLGFERETVKELVVEEVRHEIKFPHLRHASLLAASETADPVDVEVVAHVYHLERMLGIDDGGPLAIYARVE